MLSCAARIIVYHVGQPRIYMLGALKVSAIIIFGFFAAVTLPTYLEAGAPVWQAAAGELSTSRLKLVRCSLT